MDLSVRVIPEDIPTAEPELVIRGERMGILLQKRGGQVFKSIATFVFYFMREIVAEGDSGAVVKIICDGKEGYVIHISK